MASNEDLISKTEVTEEDLEKMKEKLLTELQAEIQNVDMNVTSLAMSFDALYDKLMTTLEDIDNDEQGGVQDSGSRTESFRKRQENVSQLKESADKVKNRQTKAIKSLSKLIHFIHVDREEICSNQILNICELLCIDEYWQRTDTPNNETDSYIEMLLEENKRLQERYKLMSEHAKLVRKRETSASEECFRLRKLLNDIYAKMDLTKPSDFCIVYNNDLSADDENVNDRKNVGGDMKRSLKISVGHSTQTETGSDETMHDSSESIQTQPNELKKAEERISELESQLADIKKSVVTAGHYYEVLSVYGRSPVFKHDPEKRLEILIQSLMADPGPTCEFVVERKDERMTTIMHCYGSSRVAWDDAIAKVNQEYRDSSSTAIVLLYRINSGERFCEDARKRNDEILDKFTVFSFGFKPDGQIAHDRYEEQRLIDFICSVSKPQIKVTSCKNCKKSAFKRW